MWVIKLNSIVRSSLWDYSDANVYVKGAITVSTTETALAPDNRNNNKKKNLRIALHLLIT